MFLYINLLKKWIVWLDWLFIKVIIAKIVRKNDGYIIGNKHAGKPNRLCMYETS